MPAPNFTCANGVWNCPTAPWQKSHSDSIPLLIAEEGYKEYAARFGTSQSLHRLNERGGFGSEELCILLYERIKRLEREGNH